MQEQPQTTSNIRAPWRHPRRLPKTALVALGVVALVASLLSAGLWLGHMSQNSTATTTAPTILSNGATRWANDTRTVPASSPFTLPTTAQVAVDGAFSSYYSSHAGATILGAPITPGFPVAEGWIQFYTAGALLLPNGDAPATQAESDLTALAGEGNTDQATGIVTLPLLHTLFSVGSEAVIGGGLTYADLRSAARPALLVPQPANSRASTAALQGAQSQPVFVVGGTRGNQTLGHLIPAVLWNYITRADVSPDGWQVDVGVPLTEALPFTTTVNGMPHQMLVQAFWNGALLVDQTALDASNQPGIQRLDMGLAYLRTLGLPAVNLGSAKTLWATGDIAVVSAPASDAAAEVHVGQNFPLTLLGDTAWSGGALWYHVQWNSPKTSGQGWVSSTSLTFTMPKDGLPLASFDVLSPDLANFLTSEGGNAAAVVYDVTRGRYYTYNVTGQFIMGSSVKVPIMLAFLTMTENLGRQPNSNEMYLLTTMIENSNNDSAEALFDEIGRADGLANFLHSIGITDIYPDNDAWGYSLVTPLAMVHLLTLLHEGKVLTQGDRSLAFSLMEQIESDQQVGVGDTAPQEATVAMKDGWLPGPDSLWAMNTSGIVADGNEVYIISVYTAEQNSLADGWYITRQVCKAVASSLL